MKKLCEKHNLPKSGTKNSLIKRIIETKTSNEFFNNEPHEKLEWYEKLFLSTLLAGSKKKKEIFETKAVHDFLKKIGSEDVTGNIYSTEHLDISERNLLKAICWFMMKKVKDTQ